MKRKKNSDRTSQTPAKRKISEMIWEFAGDFIRRGKTQEQKEMRLIAASNTWNIACNPPEHRRKLLDDYMSGYLRFNPETSPGDAAAIRSDMEALLKRKLKLFPADLRHIVDARLVPVGDQDRIEVVSATIG
jgi:hypothetical protein